MTPAVPVPAQLNTGATALPTDGAQDRDLTSAEIAQLRGQGFLVERVGFKAWRVTPPAAGFVPPSRAVFVTRLIVLLMAAATVVVPAVWALAGLGIWDEFEKMLLPRPVLATVVIGVIGAVGIFVWRKHLARALRAYLGLPRKQGSSA